MKYKIKLLDEAARWKGTGFNPKADKADLDKLLAKFPADELYIHFDDGVPRNSTSSAGMSGGIVLGKSGERINVPQKSFNPQTKYDTPVGIYVYPLDWAMNSGFNDLSDPASYNTLPFANDMDYVYIYHIGKSDTTRVPDIADKRLLEKTFGQLEKALQPMEIRTLFSDSACTSTLNMTTVRVYNLLKSGYDNFVTALRTELGNDKGTPEEAIGKFWFFLTRNMVEQKISSWTRLLLKYGVKFLRDDGTSTIHGSEPNQGVIMDTSVAKLIYVRENPNKRDKTGKAAALKQKKAVATAKFAKTPDQINAAINAAKLPVEVDVLLENPNLTGAQLYALYNRGVMTFSLPTSERLIKNKNFDISYFMPDLKFYADNGSKLTNPSLYSSASGEDLTKLEKMRWLGIALIGYKGTPDDIVEKVLKANKSNPHAAKIYLQKSGRATEEGMISILKSIPSMSGTGMLLTELIFSILGNDKFKKTTQSFKIVDDACQRLSATATERVIEEFFKGSGFSEEEKQQMLALPGVSNRVTERLFRFNKRLQIFRN